MNSSTSFGLTHTQNIFVFDSVRMRSHLFFRYLSTNPALSPIYHPFTKAAWLGEERWTKVAHVSAARRKEIMEDMLPIVTSDTYESLTREFETDVYEAEKSVCCLLGLNLNYGALTYIQGRVAISNEHTINMIPEDVAFHIHRNPSVIPCLLRNPTHIPDHIFEHMWPIFMVRHPVLQIDSWYRSIQDMQMKAGDEDFEILVSHYFLRCIFDHFVTIGKRPVVVDGEDVVWNTQECTKNLSAALGLDPTKFSETWQKWPVEQRSTNPLIAVFLSTIYESTGIERPDERPQIPSVDEIGEEWKTKYGEAEALKLMKLVEFNMPHYQYLHGFKV